jgi:ribosome-binding protein aMBF1 (putative translation factor)
MKKPRTETVTIGKARFEVPKETAKAVLVLLKSTTSVDEQVVLANESDTVRKLDAKYTRAGACLQGARVKEGLSQLELAARLKIGQSNLSKMELGKRAIGKAMAKRLAEILKVDYRIFL